MADEGATGAGAPVVTETAAGTAAAAAATLADGVPAAAPRAKDPAAAPSEHGIPDSNAKKRPTQNGGAGVGNAGERPERPRVVLPDPIPEQPVKRYAEPSRAELQERLNAVDAQLQQCFERLKASKTFFDQRAKIRDDGKPAFDKARATMAQSSDALKALFDKKKDIVAKIKAIKDAEQGIAPGGAGGAAAGGGGAAGDTGFSKDVNVALRGCKTIDEVNNRIRELEQRQMSSSVSLQEEKKLVAQISFLNSKGRDYIESRDKAYKDEKALKDKRMAERKELEEQRKALDAQIDAAKVIADANRAAVDRLRSDQEEQIRALAELNKDFDRDAEKNKIADLKKEMKTLRDDFHKEHDKWYLNERIYMEQQKIVKRKKWEAAQAEREAKRLAWEAEMAEYPVADPYQPEKDMCSALIFHLQNLMGTPTELSKVIKADSTTSSLLPAATSKPTLKKPTTTPGEGREIVKSAGKTIGKSVTQETTAFENDAYGIFATKSSGKKGRRGRNGNSEPASNGVAPSTSACSVDDLSVDDDGKLKPHALDHLTYFENLGIKAPTRRSELKTTLEQVVKKREYFDNNPPPKEEGVQKDGNQVGEARPSKKTVEQHHELVQKPSSSVSGPDGAVAFPGLGSNSTTEADDAAAVKPTASGTGSRPSFSDIARGHARARELSLTSSSSAFEMPGVNGFGVPSSAIGHDELASAPNGLSQPMSAPTGASTIASGAVGAVEN